MSARQWTNRTLFPLLDKSYAAAWAPAVPRYNTLCLHVNCYMLTRRSINVILSTACIGLREQTLPLTVSCNL